VVICHCRAVSHTAVLAAVRAGACDVVAVSEACGAGTGCGGCWPALQALLAAGGLMADDRPACVPAPAPAAGAALALAVDSRR
jgi:NAD(P)H-nitrite reductase large subunit